MKTRVSMRLIEDSSLSEDDSCSNDQTSISSSSSGSISSINVPCPLVPRDYQLQLAEFAQKQNCVIYLPTGTGKTLVAVLVLRKQLHKFNGPFQTHQRAVFLAPTVALTTQQARYLADHLPIEVGFYIGAHGVDHWNEELWLSAFEKNKLLVMTPQIFYTLLTTRVLPLEKIAHIVFDEAHWAGCSMDGQGNYKPTNHMYNQILDYINREHGKNRPRLLGLTASLIAKAFPLQSIQIYIKCLEKEFNARVLGSTEGNIYSAGQCIQYWTYHKHVLGSNSLRRFINALCLILSKCNKGDAKEDNLVLLLDSDGLCEIENSEDEKLMLTMYFAQLSFYFDNILCALSHLGPLCARTLIELVSVDIDHRILTSELSMGFRKLFKQVKQILDFLRKVLSRILRDRNPLELCSPQLLRLCEILLCEKQKFGDRYRCLVFVERRLFSVLIADFLDKLSKVNSDFKFLRCGYIISSASHDFLFRQSIQTQNEIIGKFRDEHLNTLITTAVLEEGIDVPECNLVIRFDRIKTFRQWVQSKGRARDKDSSFILINTKEDEINYKQEIVEYLRIEEYLENQCFLKENVDELSLKRIPNEYLDQQLQSSLGAIIHARDAPNYLQMYCAKTLACANFPKYRMLNVEGINSANEMCYVCRVYMPLRSVIRQPVDSDPFPVQQQAKFNACLKVCQQLYEMGELSENLMPKAKNNSALDFLRNRNVQLFDTDALIKDLCENEIRNANNQIIINRLICDSQYFLMLGNNKNLANGYEKYFARYLYRIDFITENPDFEHDSNVSLGLLSMSELPPECKEISCYNQKYRFDMKLNLIMHRNYTKSEIQSLNRFHQFAFKNVFQSKLQTGGSIECTDDPNLHMLIVPLCNQPSAINWLFVYNEQAKNMSNVAKGDIVRTTYNGRLYSVINPDSNVKPCSTIVSKNANLTYYEYFKQKHRITLKKNEQMMCVKQFNAENTVRLCAQQLRKNRHSINHSIYLPREVCEHYKYFTVSFFWQICCSSVMLYRIKQFQLASDLRQRIISDIKHINESEIAENKKHIQQAYRNDKNCLFNKPKLTTTLKLAGSTTPKFNSDRSSRSNSSSSSNVRLQLSSDTANSDGHLNNSICIFDPFYFNRFTCKFGSGDIEELYERIFKKTLIDENLDQRQLCIDTDTILMDLKKEVKNTPARIISYTRLIGDIYFPQLAEVNPNEYVVNFDQWGSPSESEKASLDNLIDIRLILEALTPTLTNDQWNLERLEIIGDSFLKFSVANSVFQLCCGLDEARMVVIKDKIISNKNLRHLAKQKKLEKFIFGQEVQPFVNWLPDGFSLKDDTKETLVNQMTNQALRPKTISDCVEALIGACLLTSGIRAALLFLKWLNIKVDLPSHPLQITTRQENWFPAFNPYLNKDISLTQSMQILDRIYYGNNFARLEEHLNYNFNNKALLLTAFTHDSYTPNRVTASYQALEFLGDAVIDFLIVRYLYNRQENYTPGDISSIRAALVNNDYFGCIVVRHYLHKFLLVEDIALSKDVFAFSKMCEKNIQTTDIIYNNFIVKGQSSSFSDHLTELACPKVLGDIFEALAGAVFIDSGYSLNAVWKLIYPLMRLEILHFCDHIPVSYIQYVLHEYPVAKFIKLKKDGKKICEITVNGQTYQCASSKFKIAKANVAKLVISDMIKARTNTSTQ